MMNRRAFFASLAGGLLAAPFGAEAQPAGKVWRVGLVSLGAAPTKPGLFHFLLDALREQDYVEGRNLVTTLGTFDGNVERMRAFIYDLVRAKVDVIVTTSTPETVAAKKATSTIPIVMTLVPDPVEQGLIASLARPGGNVTGLTSLTPGTSQKFVELLREAVPSASRFAVLAHRISPFPEERFGIGVRAWLP